MKKIIFLFFLYFAMPFSLLADQITFAWDANDPAPEGYRLFQRAIDGTYDYTKPIWEGEQTTATVEIPLGKWAVVCRAFAGAAESGNSNEVIFAIEPQPPAVTYTGRPKQLIINFE